MQNDERHQHTMLVFAMLFLAAFFGHWVAIRVADHFGNLDIQPWLKFFVKKPLKINIPFFILFVIVSQKFAKFIERETNIQAIKRQQKEADELNKRLSPQNKNDEFRPIL